MDQEKNADSGVPSYVSAFGVYQKMLQKEIKTWERNVRLLTDGLGKKYVKDPEFIIYIEDIGKISYGGSYLCHFSERMAKQNGRNPSSCDFCPTVLCGNLSCEERDSDRKMIGVWGLFDNSFDYFRQGGKQPQIQQTHIEAATAILLWLRKTKGDLQRKYSNWVNGGLDNESPSEFGFDY